MDMDESGSAPKETGKDAKDTYTEMVSFKKGKKPAKQKSTGMYEGKSTLQERASNGRSGSVQFANSTQSPT